MKYLIFCITVLALTNIALAGNFIDTVYSFTPGSGQNVGQAPEYYPNNIFGPPSSKATEKFPASMPEDLLSIGIGGEIVLGIKSGKMYNGAGVDFVIFENAFKREIDGVIFAEPAIVSVSQDGNNFVEFPFNEWTLSGLAGKTPTIGSISPFNYPLCGGDGFDIQELGFEYITHIKIKDVSRIVSINQTHPYYQPEFMVTGFDLDAVAIIYPTQTTSIENESNNSKILKETNNSYIFECEDDFNVYAYSLNGTQIHSTSGFNSIEISKSELSEGLILFVVQTGSKKELIKVLNVK